VNPQYWGRGGRRWSGMAAHKEIGIESHRSRSYHPYGKPFYLMNHSVTDVHSDFAPFQFGCVGLCSLP